MNQQGQQFEAQDIVTPDSSEARLSLLFKPYSIVSLILAVFILTEITVGQLYILKSDDYYRTGCEVITLPSFETHYLPDERRLIGFVRPRKPVYGVIWEELKRIWHAD